MAIEFGCPVCGGTLQVEDDAVGQVVRCGGCLAMLRVPDSASARPSFPGSTANQFPGSPDSPSSGTPPTPSRSSNAKEKSPRESLPSGERNDEKPRSPQRKRMRRESPPPAGLSPLLWGAIAIGVFGIVSCIMCCGLIPFMSEAKWQTYTSAKGGFLVDLPAKQRSEMTVRGLHQNPGFKIEGTHLWNRGEDYAVLYKDIDSTFKREANSKGVLKSTLKELEAAGLKQNSEVKEVESNGLTASEIVLLNREGENYVVRIIIADTRMYILLVGGRMTQPGEDNIQRFFTSFSITNEELLKGDERGRVALLGKGLGENSFKTIDKEQHRVAE
jgi:hypothetical protein